MRKLLTLILVMTGLVTPDWALYECWDGETPASLATGSQLVLVGKIKKSFPIGCRLDDGSIAECPKLDPSQRFNPGYPQVWRVQFAVSRAIKGDPGEWVEFLVAVPALLIGCEGPGLEANLETIVFIRDENGRSTAWGGDYASYQESRGDYEKIVSEAEDACRPGTPDNR